LAVVLVTVLGGALAGERAGAQPGPKGGKVISRQELLERFDNLTPMAQLQLIEKLPQAAKEFQSAERGDVVLMVVARGTLESARNADVYCTMRPITLGSTIAARIRSVVDNGAAVKKGDLLIQLDDTDLQDQLKDKKQVLAHSRASRDVAVEQLRVAEVEAQVEVRMHEIEVRQDELELKKYAGNNPEEKEVLQLRLERSRLALVRSKAVAKARVVQAKADLQSKEYIAEAEAARLTEIEGQIKACTIVAPQDGLVMYYIPEDVRGGTGTPRPVVAPGEPVREGQKLLQIPDLSQMIVIARVPEALVSHVRGAGFDDKAVRQHALIRVDAYPKNLLPGYVKLVDTVATPQDWFASDVKYYKTLIRLDKVTPGLRPGMSAEVAIEAERRADVMRVPVQSVVRVGKERYCYVKADGGLQKRPVTLGLANEVVVEVTGGLKQGEAVLRDPYGVLRRLIAPFAKPAEGANLLRVRTELTWEMQRQTRAWVHEYGLTAADLKRIAALPAVTQVVPVRRFAQVVRHLHRAHTGPVVGTTPEFADLFGLRPEDGRFLTAADGADGNSVAVLGAAAAEALFPDGAAVGRVVVVGRQAFTVVGVLRDQAPGGGAAFEPDRSVFVPLSTSRSRLGERVIVQHEDGYRTGEAVQVHDLYVTVAAPQDVVATREAVRTLLEDFHQQKDWTIQAGW
jgi:multidrug resistance efflux pump